MHAKMNSVKHPIVFSWLILCGDDMVELGDQCKVWITTCIIMCRLHRDETVRN
jgi:hypothetical protein